MYIMLSIIKRRKSSSPLICALLLVLVIHVSTDANFYAVEQGGAQANADISSVQPSMRYAYYGALYAPQPYAQQQQNRNPYGGGVGPLPSNVFTVVGGPSPRSAAEHVASASVASAYDPVGSGDRRWPAVDAFPATTLPLSQLPPFSWPQIGANAPSASDYRSQLPNAAQPEREANGWRSATSLAEASYARAKQQLEAMRTKALGGDGDDKAATALSGRHVDMRLPTRRRWVPPTTAAAASSEMDEDESTEWTTPDRRPAPSFSIGKSRGRSAETVEERANVASKGTAGSHPAFRSHRIVTSSVAAEEEEEESGEWEHRKGTKEHYLGSSDGDDDNNSEERLTEKKRRLEVEADEEVRRRPSGTGQQPEPCRHPGCKAWITITFPGDQRKSEVKSAKKGGRNRPPKKFTFTTGTTTTTTTTIAPPPPPSSTRRSSPEFIFSTSWVVSLKRKTTSGPSGHFSATTLSTIPSDGSSSRGSVRPFTLMPSTASQSRSKSSPSITSATLGPSVSVSSSGTTTGEPPKSRNTVSGGTEGSVDGDGNTASSTEAPTRSVLVSVDGGGGGGGGGNLDKTGSSRSQPWTHSSSRGGDDRTVVGGLKGGLPKKAHRPTPTTDSSPTIEEAAIWASTELIDAIREALAKFRAALKNRRQQRPVTANGGGGDGIRAAEEEPMESDLLRAAWDELRTGTWLERQLAQLVMADATLLEESGAATEGDGGGDGDGDLNGRLVASVLPALMRRAAAVSAATAPRHDDALQPRVSQRSLTRK